MINGNLLVIDPRLTKQAAETQEHRQEQAETQKYRHFEPHFLKTNFVNKKYFYRKLIQTTSPDLKILL